MDNIYNNIAILNRRCSCSVSAVPGTVRHRCYLQDDIDRIEIAPY
ncbi:MAG: hypothetical protein WC276_08775 [Sedimentibacter sp.]